MSKPSKVTLFGIVNCDNPKLWSHFCNTLNHNLCYPGALTDFRRHKHIVIRSEQPLWPAWYEALRGCGPSIGSWSRWSLSPSCTTLESLSWSGNRASMSSNTLWKEICPSKWIFAEVYWYKVELKLAIREPYSTINILYNSCISADELVKTDLSIPV